MEVISPLALGADLLGDSAVGSLCHPPLDAE